jgi:hypothetical protein
MMKKIKNKLVISKNMNNLDKGPLLVGESYASLKTFCERHNLVYEPYIEFLNRQYTKLTPVKKHLFLLQDDFERLKERYYEQKYLLPAQYLRGLSFYKPTHIRMKRFVKMVVADYERQVIEKSIILAITMSQYHVEQSLLKLQILQPELTVNAEKTENKI